MTRDDPRRKASRLRRTVTVLVLLYIFMCGIKLMSAGFKVFAPPRRSVAAQPLPQPGEAPTTAPAGAEAPAKAPDAPAMTKSQQMVENLVKEASNPFVGLLVGIVVTSLVQSSSVTTSIVVGMVASGVFGVHIAVPIMMGANIGTTVTNALVSMGYVMRKEQFRRALGGAIVHDVFNVLVVMILLPLELAFGLLERASLWLTGVLPAIAAEGSNVKAFDPVGWMLNPTLRLIYSLVGGRPKVPGWQAGLVIGIGLVCIFFALIMLVKVLRSMMLGKAESFIARVLGKSGWMGIIIGLLVTMMVQSSSITTSVMVPMAAAGIVTCTQIFPITIGANIGTTITALIASLAVGGAGVTIALVHSLFNIMGMLIFYPVPQMRRIPIRISEGVAQLATRHRRLALLGVFAMFYGIPALLILIHRSL
jgi:solute carrier family 34 (sodium-dependent phosphate cotransporter)